MIKNKQENLRDRIQDGYMYSIYLPDGKEIFGSPKVAREYYDAQIALGDTGEDIIETILKHLQHGPISLNQLTW